MICIIRTLTLARLTRRDSVVSGSDGSQLEDTCAHISEPGRPRGQDERGQRDGQREHVHEERARHLEDLDKPLRTERHALQLRAGELATHRRGRLQRLPRAHPGHNRVRRVQRQEQAERAALPQVRGVHIRDRDARRQRLQSGVAHTRLSPQQPQRQAQRLVGAECVGERSHLDASKRHQAHTGHQQQQR